MELFSFELSEALYTFMSDPKRCDQMHAYSVNHDVSMAEFVQLRYRDEFREYCEALGYKIVDKRSTYEMDY